jgi:hypothetical protein
MIVISQQSGFIRSVCWSPLSTAISLPGARRAAILNAQTTVPKQQQETVFALAR